MKISLSRVKSLQQVYENVNLVPAFFYKTIFKARNWLQLTENKFLDPRSTSCPKSGLSIIFKHTDKQVSSQSRETFTVFLPLVWKIRFFKEVTFVTQLAKTKLIVNFDELSMSLESNSYKRVKMLTIRCLCLKTKYIFLRRERNVRPKFNKLTKIRFLDEFSKNLKMFNLKRLLQIVKVSQIFLLYIDKNYFLKQTAVEWILNLFLNFVTLVKSQICNDFSDTLRIFIANSLVNGEANDAVDKLEGFFGSKYTTKHADVLSFIYNFWETNNHIEKNNEHDKEQNSLIKRQPARLNR